MNRLADWFHDLLGMSPDLQRKLLATAAVLLLVWLVRAILLRLVYRRSSDWRHRYRWRKSSAYLAFLLAVLVVGRVWVEAFQSLTTFLGLVSAGLVIALKDLVVNLAAWIFIVWRRPFEVGDRIQIGTVAGDVIDLRLFQFTLLEISNWVEADQSTGRIIHVPNGHVFVHPQANYDKGFHYIWHEVPVLVTFESNWRAAKEILQRIADRHEEHLSEAARERVREASRKFMIYYTNLTPTVYTAVREHGVLLTVRLLCEPRRRRGTDQVLWEDILDEFGKRDDIEFAYPTQRFYDRAAETRGRSGGGKETDGRAVASNEGLDVGTPPTSGKP